MMMLSSSHFARLLIICLWAFQLSHCRHPILGFASRQIVRAWVKSDEEHSLRATEDGIENDNEPCTIQILMSDTGGGHRASANALRDAFEVLYPGRIECDIVDIYTDYGPFWPYNSYVSLYKIMAEYDFLWEAFYRFGETDLGLCLNEIFLETYCFDSFKQCMERPSGSTNKRADMIVSVHPLCQDLPLKITAFLDSDGRTREAAGRTTPFVTVVTDLGGAHPTWFNPKVDKCFVPTDVLYDCARARGLEPWQIVEYGLPIRKGFWDEESIVDHNDSIVKTSVKGSRVARAIRSIARRRKNRKRNDDAEKEVDPRTELRTELGLDLELPTVLVVGGGDGIGGIAEIGKALGDKLGTVSDKPSYQMVVVCGKNEAAKKSLESIDWGTGIKVLVKGFVYNMDEWMKASDVLVTKAGPGTIAEASICGLPCMMFAYLPGQEEGNIPYVEASGFGQYSGSPKVIADVVSSWLSSPQKMESMRNAALEAARPSATLDIARDLAKIVFAQKQKQRQQEKVLTS